MAKKSEESEVQRAWRSSTNIVNPLLDPEMDAELAQMYRDDFREFIEPNLVIRNKWGQIVPFRMNRAQRMVYRLIQKLRSQNKPVRLIVLKARQVGISTLLAAIMYTVTRFWPRSDGRIVSFERESAANIFSMIELFQESLDDDIRPPLLRKTTSLLQLGNKDPRTRHLYPGLRSSILTGTAKNLNIGRGSTYRILHATEVAYYNRAHDTMQSLMQCVPSTPDTFVFMESSSVGAGGFFHREFMRSVQGKSEWTPVFIPFWFHEEYEDDLTPEEELAVLADADGYERSLKDKFKNITWGHISWRRHTLSEKCQGSRIAFNREFAPTMEEAFASQGETLFDLNAVAWFMDNTVQEGRKGEVVVTGDKNPRPYFRDSDRGYLTVYKMPQPGMHYVIGADAAMGKKDELDMNEADAVGDADIEDEDLENDYCAAVVLDQNAEQVAEYRCRIIDPYSFADILAALGYFYNEAVIMPETTPGANAAGFGVMYRLKEIYTNIGRWEVVDKVTNKTTQFLGWEINAKTKSVIVGLMQREVLRGAGMLFTRSPVQEKKPKLIIRSQMLCDELTTFVKLRGGGGVGARGSDHDDLVIALGLALKAMEQIRGVVPENQKRADELREMYASQPEDIMDHSWMEV